MRCTEGLFSGLTLGPSPRLGLVRLGLARQVDPQLSKNPRLVKALVAWEEALGLRVRFLFSLTFFFFFFFSGLRAVATWIWRQGASHLEMWSFLSRLSGSEVLNSTLACTRFFVSKPRLRIARKH